MGNRPSKYKPSNFYILVATVLAVAVFLLSFFLSIAMNPSGFLIDVIVSAMLAAGVYIGAVFLLKPTIRFGGISVDTIKNGEELRKLVEAAYTEMTQISDEISAIADAVVKSSAQKVYDGAFRIIQYVEQNPDKYTQARRFFTYYLDMTHKIIRKYNDFIESRLNTDEMNSVLEQTQKALTILEQTFTSILSNLMRNEIMDIEADVSLLESMYKSESK